MGQLWLSCKIEAIVGYIRPCCKKFHSTQGNGEPSEECSCPLWLDTAPPEKLSAAVGELGQGSMHELGLEDGGG